MNSLLILTITPLNTLRSIHDIPSDLSDKLFELKGIFNAYEFKGEAPAFKEIFESDEDYERILEYKSSYAAPFFNVFKYFYNDATKLTIMLK